MNIELLKYPTEEDWIGCKLRTLVTVGKSKVINPPDEEWKRKILRARHSPIRYLQFSFKMTGVPYWVSVHLCRHIHAQPYVKSQRNDRQNQYDRNSARQDEPVDLIWDMNAEELITICEKRLCRQASEETRNTVMGMKLLVLGKCPEFSDLLYPPCVKTGRCNEMFPCDYGQYLNGEKVWQEPKCVKEKTNAK